MTRNGQFGCLLLSVIFCLGCLAQSHPPPTYLAVRTGLPQYAKNAVGPEGGVASFDFPVLEIYNSRGLLVFHSHGSTFDRASLAHLLRRFRTLRATDHPAQLSAVTRNIPAWNLNRPASTSRGTIVSILSRDQASASTREAIESLRPVFQKKNLDVLVLNLEMTSVAK